MLERKKVLNTTRDYLMLTLASFIFAWAWEGFMIPNGMSAGGMMGLCTVVQYATGGLIPASISYVVVNALLIITAVLALGIGFGFKTIYCIAVSSLAMKLLGDIEAVKCLPGCFFYVRETLLIPIIAGALEALGIGLVLRYGGSTGGTDIIALMINKYWPINLSKVFFVSDFVVVFLILLLPGKAFADMVYGFVEITAFTMLLDTVVGGQKSYQILVFSEKYNEIADYIVHGLDRGVTVMKSIGWFTGKERNVLLIVIGQKQFLPLSKKIKEMDPKAFMSVAPTHNVYGEGFEEIKVGLSKKLKEIDENPS